MKNKVKFVTFTLILLLSVCFTVCHNSIMEKWWPEPEEKQVTKIDPPILIDPPERSGENFAIVAFDTDGGTPQPKSVRVAWGTTIGRLRPIIRGIDGFIGWFDENGDPWDIETRSVLREDDVDGDGFITLTVRWIETQITIPPPPPPPVPPPPEEPPIVAPVYIVRFIPYPEGVTPPAGFDLDAQFPDLYIAAGSKVVQPLKPSPYNTTHGFAGWYLRIDPYQNEWDFDQPVAASVTLYAKWELDIRTVRFEANGGLRPDGITELTHEFTISLNYGLVQDPGPLVKPGFHFDGWYTYPDFSYNRWNFAKKITDSDVPQVNPLIFYAKWERNKYIVNFVVTPSAAPPPAQQFVFHDEKVIQPFSVIPPAGFRFDGWYTENTFVTLWNFDNTITNNLTLYAKFAELSTDPIEKPSGGSGENFAIVFFDTAGGTTEDDSVPHYVKVAYGSTVGRLRPIYRGTDGFQGWFDENGEQWDVETQPVTEEDVNIDGFIILTARWQQAPSLIYKVDFIIDPDSENIFLTQLVGVGGKVVQPVNPPKLADGRAFAGWYLERDPEYRYEWDFSEPPANNITLYARWEYNARTVIFITNEGTRGNGNTLNPDSVEVPLSYGLVQDPGPLVRIGYHFIGWYMFSDFSGTQWNFATKKITDSDVPNYNNPAIDLELYAKWELNVYFVDFVISPSLAEVPHQQEIPHGEKVVRPANLPMLGDGRAFNAWYTEAEHYNQWDFDSPVTSSMTLYARFAPQTRTVHFQPNGGVLPSGMEMRISVTIPVTSGTILNPGILVKPGFTFGGWYTDPGCTIPWNFATDRVTTPDEIIAMDPMYLYAKWTANPNTVTFNFYEAANPLIQTQSVEYGERAVKPTAPENAGRSLEGWFTQDGRGSGSWGAEWDFDTRTVTSNTTLHARWVDADYIVKFHFGRPNGTDPHSIYFSTNVHDQTHHINDKVTEPFMPPLPAGDTTSWSFVRWDYHPDDPDTVPGAGPTEVNNQVFRDALLPWNFDTEIDDTNTSSVGRILNLYARWIPPDPDMVWVPRGSFIMGDSGVSGSPAAYHAYPTRKITLDGFFIGRYPITEIKSPDSNRGYLEVMGNNPSQFHRNEIRPVDRVSWYDAIEFCIELTALENRTLTQQLGQVYTMNNINRAATPLSGTPGYTVRPIVSANVEVNWSANGYRLPTEAEWEYAAKGGNGMGPYFIYSGSNDPVEVAWYNETVKNEPAGLQATQIVGRKKANVLGIYDMSGNISEWVWDRFMSYKDYIALNPADLNVNPIGPATGNERVRRGGAWSNAAGNVRSVVRNSDTPNTATWVNGFRVVRGPSHIW